MKTIKCRPPGAVREGECEVSITDQVKAWLPRGIAASDLLPLTQRLRTTAEALRAFVDSRRESGWAIAAGKNAGPALNKALPDARAVLAALEKEGLT